MAITVVQTATAQAAASGSFGSNVTAGNSIVLAVMCGSVTNVTISTSNPLFNGSSVSGAASLAAVQSAFSNNITLYTALWLLPDVSGGATGFSITAANGTFFASAGLIAYEVAGLGASPSADKSSTGSATSGTAISSGATGNTTSNNEIVVGSSYSDQGSGSLPGAPWTSTAGWSSNNAIAGYQVQTSSGQSYTWSATQSGSDVWSAAVATVAAASGTPHTATGSLTVTPAFTLVKAEAHVEKLTVTPAFAIVKAEAHKQALTVTPQFASQFSHTGTSIGGGDSRHHHRAGPWGR